MTICSGNLFVGDKVFVGFAFADYPEAVAFDEYLGGAGSGVILAAHGEAIGAGSEKSEQVAAFQGGQ